MNGPVISCPDCAFPLGPEPQAFCPHCRLPLEGPDAAELWQVNTTIARLDAERAKLMQRRNILLDALRARRDAPSPAVSARGVSGQGVSGQGVSDGGDGAAPRQVRRREISTPSVQTLLLILGVLLVALAGLVFTFVNWGRLGIGGRAAVLAVLTVLALTLPIPLRRRHLTATAEATGAIGLALVLLDCHAARATGLAGLDRVDGPAYWAVATGLIAAGMAGYGWLTRSSLMPVAGLLILQPTALLTAIAAGVGGAGSATAMACTCALDLAVATALVHRGAALRDRLAARSGAWAAAALWGLAHAAAIGAALLGGMMAVTQSLGATSYGQALRACAPLIMFALLGLAVAARRRDLPYGARAGAATASGIALTAAVAAVPWIALPADRVVLAHALPAALLGTMAIVRRTGHEPAEPSRKPGSARPVLVGFTTAGATILAITGLAVLPGLLGALTEPMTHMGSDWSRSLPGSWKVAPAALVVTALIASMTAAGAMLRAATVTPAAAAGDGLLRLLRCGTVLAAAPAITLAPVAAHLPYGAAVATAGATALLAAGHLLRRPLADRTPQLCALLAPGVLTLGWALADRTATLVTWGAAALLAAGLAAALPDEPRAGRWKRSPAAGAGAFSVAAFGVEAERAASAAGLTAHLAAFAVLAVAAASAPVAVALKGRLGRPGSAVAVEATGYCLAAVALLMSASSPDAFSLALALSGAAALGVALRADRRQAAAVAGIALLTASSWVRLALAHVHAPEPYTVTVSAAVLILGHLRRRQVPRTSSWAAYGIGLSSTLLPSLAAAWEDVHWVRPLLLGSAALAVTLLGARHRLQAPLLIGALVVVAVGLHELAPTIVQTLGLLPRWVPPAAAGLLLLYLGATYEQRLRDARRLRHGLRLLR